MRPCHFSMPSIKSTIFSHSYFFQIKRYFIENISDIFPEMIANEFYLLPVESLNIEWLSKARSDCENISQKWKVRRFCDSVTKTRLRDERSERVSESWIGQLWQLASHVEVRAEVVARSTAREEWSTINLVREASTRRRFSMACVDEKKPTPTRHKRKASDAHLFRASSDATALNFISQFVTWLLIFLHLAVIWARNG